MKNGSTGSPTPEADAGRGWGPNNELFYELWPMEIPAPQDETENDPLEFPLRVPMSGLLNNPTSKENV